MPCLPLGRRYVASFFEWCCFYRSYFQVVLDEFYTAGGKASHVLHVLDTSETKTKANEVGLTYSLIRFS